jgi:3-hydroxybutyryl-CoA dehydrogenase
MTSAARHAAVGAGRMGRGIAIALALAGERIALVDLRRRTPQAWLQLQTQVQAEIDGGLRGLVAIGALEEAAIAPVTARITLVDAEGAPAALAAADLLFEGVPETLDAKRDAIAAMNAHCRADAVITSTTSSILVTQLAPLVAHPERFLNMHWLNPAYLIPVVELSPHPGTAPAVVQGLKQTMQRIGKLPVLCGPTPGYIVPRLQALVMNEAARMVEEGAAAAEEIDKATRFGMALRFAAIGVVEFIDFGGVDILHHASREMSASISAERYAAPAIVGRLMAEGRLGLKTGSGFFEYDAAQAAAYRAEVLGRVFRQLQQAGLWRAPVVDSSP